MRSLARPHGLGVPGIRMGPDMHCSPHPHPSKAVGILTNNLIFFILLCFFILLYCYDFFLPKAAIFLETKFQTLFSAEY